jgi:hypothetical protein
MYLTTFISNFNKARFLTPLLLNQTLVVEIRPYQKSSHFIEFTSNGAKKLVSPPKKIDFTLEGDEQDISEVLLHDVSLKQLIAFRKISIKGTYRTFLRVEAIIKLC